MGTLNNFYNAGVDLRFDADDWYVNGEYVQSVGYMSKVFDHIKKVGYDGVTLLTNVPINLKTGEVSTLTADGKYDRPLPRHFWEFVDLAKQKDLNVIVKLHIVNVENDNGVTKSDTSGASFSEKRFFEMVTAYEKQIAIKANEHKVDGLYIGVLQNGLDGEGYRDQWTHLVSEIRSVYNGILLYHATVGLKQSPLYELVDVIGLYFAYYLNDLKTYDVHDIIKYHEQAKFSPTHTGSPFNVANEINSISNQYKKPVVLDSVIFRAGDKNLGGTDFWAPTVDGKALDVSLLDYNFQQARYEAFFNLAAKYITADIGMMFREYMPWIDSFVYQYEIGSPNPNAKKYYEYAKLGEAIKYSPVAENTISNYINQPYNFSTYHLGTDGADTILGSSLNDYFVASAGNDTLNGGTGFDILRVHGTREAYSVSKKSGFLELAENSSAAKNVDTLDSIEKIIFTNGALVFDVTSTNAPAAYRLYGGAFDRTPDEGGFRFWASTLDKNVSLRDVAAEFISSGEFIGRYGSSLSNAAFVDALYQNVLHRGGDAGGIAYWNQQLDTKTRDRPDVLVQFTQLPEFVGISAANISNGYWVV